MKSVLGINILNNETNRENNTTENIEHNIKNLRVDAVFKLPIQYLEKEKIHLLNDIVRNDLELEENNINSVKSMYEYIFEPQNQFSKNMISCWNKYFTTDIEFLKESQDVLKNISTYLKITPLENFENIENTEIIEIWKDTKEDKNFLEKYSYMEWDLLKHLNYSSSFLLFISFMNIASPIVSFIYPIIFLIIPFIILKFRQIPINLSVYLEVLKTIAKTHFIGKSITNLENINIKNIFYVIVMSIIYFMQLYQNFIQCLRFQRNMKKINIHLFKLKKYLNCSIVSMENFVKTNNYLPKYRDFCNDIEIHKKNIVEFNNELNKVNCFDGDFKISKIMETGNLLKCFYILHSNDKYEKSILFSVGFHGYLDNLISLNKKIEQKKLSYANFNKNEKTKIIGQYYPCYINKKHVKNDCNLSKNIIISGINGSGKTTILKTTAINILFSQQIGVGCYKNCQINPYTNIHSYLNIPDTSNRDSLFQSEARRCKTIIDNIEEKQLEISTVRRHFCIFDELYSGTNPNDAVKTAYGFLLYLSKFNNVDFMMTTHYIKLCRKMKKSDKIQNYKTIIEYSKSHIENEIKNIIYTYEIKKGISTQNGAIHVLKDMNYPKEIIEQMSYTHL